MGRWGDGVTERLRDGKIEIEMGRWGEIEN